MRGSVFGGYDLGGRLLCGMVLVLIFLGFGNWVLSGWVEIGIDFVIGVVRRGRWLLFRGGGGRLY